MGHEKIWHGGNNATQTPFANMDFLSPQPGRGSDLFFGVSGKSNLFFSVPNGYEFE
jgi:hypothetical protein